MQSLEEFQRKHRVETVTARVMGKEFKVFRPLYLEDYIKDSETGKSFPLWARVWESSLVLASYLAQLPRADTPILELGAGLGFSGIVGLAFGHEMHITECDEDALEYIQANLLQNRLDSTPNRIFSLDWSTKSSYSHLPPYKLVVGSEIIYRESDIGPVLDLLKILLAEGGRAVLIGGMRPSVGTFAQEAMLNYSVKAKRIKYSSPHSEEKLVLIELSSPTAP